MDISDLTGFSVSAIVASLIFSIVGIYVFRKGKKEAHTPHVYIGLALMIYGYFTPTAIMAWGVGAALCGAAYYYR